MNIYALFVKCFHGFTPEIYTFLTNLKATNMDKKTIHEEHRKRMKEIFTKNGLSAFSDIQKLEFILYFSIPRKDTNPIAHRLLDTFGSFDKVLEAPLEKLQAVEGIGEHSAMLISSYLKIFECYGKSKCETSIAGTTTAKEYCKNLYKGKSVEEFYMLCLTSSNKVMSCNLVNRGTASEVPVDIRKLTNIIVANNCERVLITHNHPHGPVRPSDEDIAFTAKIVSSCILNSIEVIDHIIVNDETAFSFEEAKILKELKRDAIKKIPGFSQKEFDRFGQESTNYKVGK